jgi:hypothetical protein
MKREVKIGCNASSVMRDEVYAAAADLGIMPSEFIRLAIIHAVKTRPAEAFATPSGMRRKGNPNFCAKQAE